MTTQRARRRARILRNRIARRSAHHLGWQGRWLRLNPAACPFLTGNSWKFDENDQIIEDGVSPLGLVGSMTRGAAAEREMWQNETLTSLRTAWRVVTSGPSQKLGRIKRERDGIWLLHAQKLVPLVEVESRIWQG